MQKYIILLSSLVLLGLTAIPSFAKPISTSSYQATAVVGDTSAQDIDSLAICVLQGWMNTIRVLLSEEECLPRNEASQMELDSNRLNSNFFVPNMIGYWMLAAVLSHEAKTMHPGLTMGFDQQELLDKLHCIMDALEDIIANHAFVDSLETGKIALYQIHLLNGEAPRGDNFERTISMLDNVFLVTALKAVANWSLSIDPALHDRIDSTLAAFDMSMWRQNNNWHLGGPENPRAGSLVDRILSETRLIHVAALARGEIDLGQFAYSLHQNIDASVSHTTPQGISVAQQSAFGRALEKWVVSSILSTELQTAFACNTLYPLIDAQEETKCSLDLIGYEATPIGDGFGNFLEIGISPSERVSTHQDVNMLIPPAIMMQAGVMAQNHPVAACNFREAIKVLADSSQLTSRWGPALYLDFGTNLVNTDNPLWGTLEIEQGAVALLNMLLGGDYIEQLLRQDSNWNFAIDHYARVLDRRFLLREAEEQALGAGFSQARPPALADSTWWLNDKGDQVSYEINLPHTGNYQLLLRYSNDDFADALDHLIIAVDGIKRDSFFTLNTGDFGLGWFIFELSPVLELGTLAAGSHTITITVDEVSAHIEIDALLLYQEDAEFFCNYEFPNDSCDCMITALNSPEFLPQAISIAPNPAAAGMTIRAQIPHSQTIQLQILDPLGRVVQNHYRHYLANSELNFEWDTSVVPPGMYYLVVSGEGGKTCRQLVVMR